MVPKPAQVVRCVARVHWREHSRLLPGVARVVPILPASLISLICMEIPRSEVVPECREVLIVARDLDVVEAPDELQLQSVAFLWASRELASSHPVEPLRAVSARVREKLSSA